MAQLSGQPRLQDDDSVDPRTPRSACERCRAHKLKCIRSQNPGHLSQCDRCGKAGLDCHTRPSLPPGRPRLEHGAKVLERPSIKRKATDKPNGRPGPEFDSSSARMLRLTSTNEPLTPALNETFLTTFEDASTDAVNALCSSAALYRPNSLITDQNVAIDMVGDIDPDPGFMGFTGSGVWTEINQNQNFTFPPPIDKKRYYLDKLAELNSSLLKYIADTSGLSSADASPSHEEASVEQILEFLEEFHGILKYYLLTIPIRSAPRLSAPDTANSDDDSEPEFAEDGTSQGQPLISLVSKSQGVNGIDYPTVLAISTCYVSLVRLCRSWLQNMVKLLEASVHRMTHYTTSGESSHLGNQEEQDCPPISAFCNHLLSDIPHVLPGVQLGGFQLGNYRSLQISVFIQVSMDLLWRVERGVAALVATDCIGPPASSKNLALLKTMLQQEARVSDRPTPRRHQRKPKDDDLVGVQSLKFLARTVRKSLRSNVCLQLEEGTLDWGDFAL